MKSELGWVEDTWQHIVAKVKSTSQAIGATFPHASQGGRYDAPDASWWTAGFWPGILWSVHVDTKDAALAELAERCEEQLDEVLHGFTALDHDLGFMWLHTAVANYTITRNEASRRRALTAASHLAGRFNPAGFIRAWNGDAQDGRAGWAIIDCMMNLELLYWASAELHDPRFSNVARCHANTALREFVRPDGSVYHIVGFNPQTGERVAALAGQGHAETSAWARGTAWALYGFATSFAYTGDERFLAAAKHVAHFFVANLPEDLVPHWDFRVPRTAETPRDASAAAIAACGLLALAQWVPEAEAGVYQGWGTAIARSLATRCTDWQADEQGLLLHSTGHFPEQRNVDVPIIYGDYYFVEAISRLRSGRVILPAPQPLA